MTKHVQFLYFLFIVSLCVCFFTPVPAVLTLLALIYFQTLEILRAANQGKSVWEAYEESSKASIRALSSEYASAQEKIESLESRVPTEDQLAGTKLSVVLNEMATAIADLRSEVNGLNLRAGLGKK